MRKFMGLIVSLVFSYSLSAYAGDGALKVTTFGAIFTSSLAVTFFPTSLTDDSEASTRNSRKKQDQKIVDARNDAAAFVASDGGILGAQLESALSMLEAFRAEKSVDEMQLAKAILAYQSQP